MLKRLFDILVAAIGLAASSPALAAIALAVRVDSPGPILFRQRRVGRRGLDFTMLKFRSMAPRPGAEGGSFDAGDSSHVTRVGHILRATKLDELPQLWNVLVGEMSMVGPRPEVRAWVDADPERWAIALSVSPGVTDLASILYRDEEQLLAASADPNRLYAEEILPRKLAIYGRYATTHTFGGDLLILLRTARALLPSRTPPRSGKGREFHPVCSDPQGMTHAR